MKLLQELLSKTGIEEEGVYFESYKAEVIATVDTKHKPDLIFFKIREHGSDTEYVEIGGGFTLDKAVMFINSIFGE